MYWFVIVFYVRLYVETKQIVPQSRIFGTSTLTAQEDITEAGTLARHSKANQILSGVYHSTSWILYVTDMQYNN